MVLGPVGSNLSIATATNPNEYTLDGGVTVCDRTNGVTKVIFSQEITEKYSKPAYKITIAGKKLIYPIASRPSDAECFLIGSQKITIEVTEKLFTITEVDSSGENVFYVDTSNDVDGVAYDIYNYLPKAITWEEAKRKFAHLTTECPNFKADRKAYNRHGVGVFGYDSTINDYAFYWASPSDERVERMDCLVTTRDRDGGTSIAKTKNYFVNFRYLARAQKYFMNGEEASMIV